MNNTEKYDLDLKLDFIALAELLEKSKHELLSNAVVRAELLRDIKKREHELTPPGGWDGSNQHARDWSKEEAFTSNEKLQELYEILAEYQDKRLTIETEIECLSDRRRAYEWYVRFLETKCVSND